MERDNPGYDQRPDPDPTRLTLDVVQREIDGVRREIANAKDLVDERFHTMDERHRTICTRVEAVEKRFELTDEMRKELKEDHLRSLDLALSSMKEQSDRIESSITRSFAEQSKSQASDTRRLEDQINGLGNRFTDLVERVKGVEERNVGARNDRTSLYATLGAIVAVALVVLQILQLTT